MSDAAPAHEALASRPGAVLRGRIRAPGDKSISHRALILGAMAEGETTIEGLLEGDDVWRSARAMQAMGAKVERRGEGLWRILGRGRLSEPDDVVDCGNAGTAVRLIIGAAAGFSGAVTYTGDASLRSRPMGRVLTPLGLMGAAFVGREGPRLPLTVRGGELTAVRYAPPEPSAQVKSSVLLAGLNAEGTTAVVEREPTRDHTERMLRGFGAHVSIEETPEGRVASLAGGQRLSGCDVIVPGDPSSAAFPLIAALVSPGSEVTVEGVLLNPLRTGILETLQEMGADLAVANEREVAGERVGDVTARASPLRGVDVPAWRAVSMIDEFPILAVAAAFAEGPTTMRGLAELRVKESDRLALIAAGLAACGVAVEEGPDWLAVAGAGASNRPVQGGARVATHGDHRIAMSFLVLGLAAREPVAVDQAEMIATSFPGFAPLMARLGADFAAV